MSDVIAANNSYDKLVSFPMMHLTKITKPVVVLFILFFKDECDS